MHALTLSDFGSNMDSLVPKVSKTNILLALALRNPIARFIIFTRTKAVLHRITQKFDNALQDLKADDIELEDPKNFRERIQEQIYEFSELRSEFKDLDYYTDTQAKVIRDLITVVIKKMMKLETISIKQINNNQPKVDDSELIQLVMNNNSIELQKNIQAK